LTSTGRATADSLSGSGRQDRTCDPLTPRRTREPVSIGSRRFPSAYIRPSPGASPGSVGSPRPLSVSVSVTSPVTRPQDRHDAVVTMCEWDGCGDGGTHTVAISFSDGPSETWCVCRQHDRMLKNQVRRSRARQASRQPQGASSSVSCASCGLPLDERPDQDAAERSPCPTCGSLGRQVNITATDSALVHECVRTREKRAGRSGWLVDTKSGDSYTRDLRRLGAADAGEGSRAEPLSRSDRAVRRHPSREHSPAQRSP
jgi:hypothetical protein